MVRAERGTPVTGPGGAGLSVDEMTVAVVIPTFNHAGFLTEAIKSVLAQTRQPDEIIVVDDGSTDDPATIVVQFPTVRIIRQDNSGPSAARNVGLRHCKTSHIVFFDADDRLLPTALEAGMKCIARRPDLAFVYGGHRRISEDGHPIGPDVVRQLKVEDAHLAFLRQNLAGPPMTALFRRDCLMTVNGFDETLHHCEDYDVYLRLAERYPIASHSTLVAEHRMHGHAASNDHVKMLKGGLLVLDLNEARVAADPAGRAAIQEGRVNIRSYYVPRMLDAASARWRAGHDIGILVRDLIQAARWSPFLTARTLLGAFRRRASKWLPRVVGRVLS